MDISELLDLASAYWKSATLTAAVELDLFRHVRDPAAPASAAEIATALEASPKYTTALLDALAGIGILTKSAKAENEIYSIPDSLRPYLDPESPDSMLGALRFNAAMVPLWGKLADCTRAGTPAIPPNAQLGSDPQRVAWFVHGMHSRARALAPGILPHIDLAGRTRLLDVAAGPGTFSAMMIEQQPDIHLTVFDLPAVSAVSQQIHGEGPVADRMTFVQGDYHSDPLPSGPFDAVLYCGAVHQEDETHTREVLSKIHSVLEPGGRLFLVDLMLEADRTTPVFSALFEINMMLTNSMSHVHTVEGAMALVDGAGFGGVAAKDMTGTPYTLVTGVK